MTDSGSRIALEMGPASGVRGRTRQLVLFLSRVWAWAFLGLMVAFFVVVVPLASNGSVNFLTTRNSQNILVAITPVLLLGLGQTFVIIGAGIDLSVGWVMSLASVLSALAIRAVFNLGLPLFPSVVIGLIPIVQSVAAVMRHGERPRPLFWFASAVGVSAVVLFAAAEGAGRPQLADLWLLLAMISAGIGYAEGGVLARDMGGWRVICWALVLAAPLLAIPVAVDLAHRDLHVSAHAWAGFAYVSIVSMFLAFFAWYKSLALGGIAAGGQMLLFQPILSAVWASLFLREPIGPRAWAAALLVLTSVALSRWSQMYPARLDR